MCFKRIPKEDNIGNNFQFAPSNVPKFKYSYTHNDYKKTVCTLYNRIRQDLVVFRLVSSKVSDKDFCPMCEDKIIGDEELTKIDIDKRSISFFSSVEGCEYMALKKYESEIERFGAIKAEQWKKDHEYVVELTLTNEDGYTDNFDTKGHINFAPFKSFNHHKSINNKNMKLVNYQQPHVRLGILQGGDGNKYVTLFYDGNDLYSLEVINENYDGVYCINNLYRDDIVKYIKGKVTIKNLALKCNIKINSKHGIYGYISPTYNVDNERILSRINEENKKSRWSLFYVKRK